MRKMKKVFWMLLLGMSVCLAGQQAEVLASERAPENKKSVQEKYVDLSDEIIQEGGFLKETDISENRAGDSAEVTDTQRQVQNELTAAWDSFADSCDLTAYQITAGELRERYTRRHSIDFQSIFMSAADIATVIMGHLYPRFGLSIFQKTKMSYSRCAVPTTEQPQAL